MPAIVQAVRPGSIAQEAGLEPGDILDSINGQPLRDIIDYRFLESDEELTLQFTKQDGDCWDVEVEKDWSEPLGIEFVSPVFDRVRHCANHCAFCFVDQMPQGMRQTLYMKDDDYRLSFLTGNFVTLTNLTDADWQRIESYRLSPLYVSVHTTDADLRQKMLGNPKAGQILQNLRRLQKAGIELHCQIVCVPGVNSGKVLDQTLLDLAELWPAVRSVAIVPVGLSQFRTGLEHLEPWTQQTARQLVLQVERKQREFLERFGTRLVWAADEFYLLGEHPVPQPEVYEEYRQLENGIGLTSKFRQEFFSSMSNSAVRCISGEVTLVTSWLGEKALQPVTEHMREVLKLKVRVVPVPNRFFGPSITVTGLLVGQDILASLADYSPSQLGKVLVPGVALNDDQLFLDDMPLSDLQREVGCPVQVISGGEELATKVCANGETGFSNSR